MMKKKQAPYYDEGDGLVIKFEDEYGMIFVSRGDENPKKNHLACTRLLQKGKPE